MFGYLADLDLLVVSRDVGRLCLPWLFWMYAPDGFVIFGFSMLAFIILCFSKFSGGTFCRLSSTLKVSFSFFVVRLPAVDTLLTMVLLREAAVML